MVELRQLATHLFVNLLVSVSEGKFVIIYDLGDRHLQKGKFRLSQYG